MKPENAIEVKDITKSFKVFIDRGNTIKERALFSKRRKYDYRQVLKGISFEVKKGEAIGFIGQNGCGKSTTLKLLTKIIYPDSGSIEIQGRVSSLIELGAGFHPDLSGRENIYINASIFGLGKKEIDRRLDDIIAFSELEEFIDNPVRTYSSGMYMRLAFSVAINVDADVLLIDEILAVGDANFQAKCFNKLREIKAMGTTIVIVSHSLGQIEQICERSIWIDKGVIREIGAPREVHPLYMNYMGQKREERYKEEKKIKEDAQKIEQKKQGEKESLKNDDIKVDSNITSEILNDKTLIGENSNRPKEVGNRDVVITDAKLYNGNYEETLIFKLRDSMVIEINYERNNPEIKNAVVGFHIFRNDGMDCCGSNTIIDKLPMGKLQEEGVVRIEIGEMWLAPAKYEIDLAFCDEFGLTYHHLSRKLVFEIIGNNDVVGVGEIRHKYYYDNIYVGGIGYGE